MAVVVTIWLWSRFAGSRRGLSQSCNTHLGCSHVQPEAHRIRASAYRACLPRFQRREATLRKASCACDCASSGGAELITLQREAESTGRDVALMVIAQIAHQAEPVVHRKSHRKVRAFQTGPYVIDHTRIVGYAEDGIDLTMFCSECSRCRANQADATGAERHVGLGPNNGLLLAEGGGADCLQSYFLNGSGNGDRQNSLRLSTGVVFSFGNN